MPEKSRQIAATVAKEGFILQLHWRFAGRALLKARKDLCLTLRVGKGLRYDRIKKCIENVSERYTCAE